MPYVITTPIVEGMNLQDHEMWNVLIAAANVALVAAGFPKINWNDAVSPSVGSTFSPSDIGQNSTIFSHFYTVTFPQNDGIQTAISRLKGVTSGGTSPSMGDLRLNADLPITLVRPITTGYTDNWQWRRMRPREIDVTSAILDAQGNSFAIGQLAYLTGIDGTVRYFGRQWCGELAKCTSITNNPTGDPFGTVNWELASELGITGKADLLDNTLDYPNTVAIDTHAFDAGQPGTAKSGDYFGAHILEELRLIITQL